MTIDELEFVIFSTKWLKLGEGTFNKVLVSIKSLTIEGFTGKWVAKIPINRLDLLSSSSRAVDKWNLHNPKYPAFQTNYGWIAPYVGKTPASDQQIADKLIEIYRNTRQVIADACGKNNFLIYDNEVICVDVDLSVRRGSFASDDYMNDDVTHRDLMRYLTVWSNRGKPKSVAVIQSLLYLQKNIPEQDIKNEYITPLLIEKLHLFWVNNAPLSVDILEFLVETMDPNLITPQYFMTLSELSQHTAASGLIHDQLLDYSWTSRLTQDEFLHLVQLVVDKDSPYLNKIGKDGYTLLHIAVINKHDEIVQYLISEGVDLNIITAEKIRENAILRYPNMTAIDIAYGLSNCDHIATLLFNANSSNQYTYTAHEYSKFHLKATLLAQRTDPLTTQDRDNLQVLISKPLHYLIWELNDEGDTFLHLAFTFNHPFIINELVNLAEWPLLSQTKNLKSQWTLLHCISYYGWCNLYEHVKAADIHAVTKNTHSTALHIAFNLGYGDFCTILLEHGADLYSKNNRGEIPEDLWCETDTPNPFEAFRTLREELIFLAQYCENPPDATLTELLDRMIQNPHLLTLVLDDEGDTFLHHVFYANNRHIINQLIQLPQWPQLCQIKNSKNNMTLIHYIAYEGHYQLLKYCKAVEVDTMSSSKQHTALLIAAGRGHNSCCSQLIRMGANINHQDNQGNSILMFASVVGHVSTCELLIKAGADRSIKNENNETAAELWSGPYDKNPFTAFKLKSDLRFFAKANEGGNKLSVVPSYIFGRKI